MDFAQMMALPADERSSRPPDIGDVPQAIGVRGPHASAADALFEGDASREHAVVGHAPGPLVIGDHHRKLSRQPIIHDRMIRRDGAGFAPLTRLSSLLLRTTSGPRAGAAARVQRNGYRVRMVYASRTSG